MIGGSVIRVHRESRRVFITVQGTTFADTCVILVVATVHDIQPGDTLSWQGRFAWWTRDQQPSVAIERCGFAMSERQAARTKGVRSSAGPA